SSRYWRPLSRQVYFALVAPWLIQAPWIDAVLHAAMLAGLALAMYRLARRAFDAPTSAAIASFPILAEPSRVLLAWPTGAEYLLAMLAAVLAVSAAAAGRRIVAAVALMAALLSHESAVVTLAVVPIVGAWRTRR